MQKFTLFTDFAEFRYLEIKLFIFIFQFLRCFPEKSESVYLSILPVEPSREKSSTKNVQLMRGHWANEYVSFEPQFYLTPTLAVVSTSSNIHVFDFFSVEWKPEMKITWTWSSALIVVFYPQVLNSGTLLKITISDWFIYFGSPLSFKTKSVAKLKFKIDTIKGFIS